MLIKNYSLKEHNTFGVDVKAAAFIAVKDERTVSELCPMKQKFLILGGGSNMLFTQHFNGLVIHNQIKEVELLKNTASNIIVRVGGGVKWHTFVKWAVNNDYGGIENLSLIPGTVGAAPVQNIGAYGVELKDVFVELEAVELKSGKKKIFSKADCKFGYRDSIFKNKFRNKYFISRVVFKLTKKHTFNLEYGIIKNTIGKRKPSLKVISEAIIKIRNSKLPDPSQLGNAGSFFKNPTIDVNSFMKLKMEYMDMPFFSAEDGRVKLAAAWLIEHLGWKGYKKGRVGVHDKQALVLVNHGGASGKDIWKLARSIQSSVQDNFGILLEPEVNVL